MQYKHLLLWLFATALLSSCYNHQRSEDAPPIDLPDIVRRDTLTAVTLNSSTSYFHYKMQPMGYEYDLVADFARSHGLELEIRVAENTNRLIEMLQNGEADIAAYPVPVTAESKTELLFCGHEMQSSLVVVQRAEAADTLLRDVTELIGKSVHVKPGTRYYERLKALNSELGGGIDLIDITKDTVTTEDLIEAVARGEIRYTVCEDDVARLNRTYFRNINISLSISFRQRSSWAVRKSSPLLAAAIDEWASNSSGRNTFRAAIKRYFEQSKNIDTADTAAIAAAPPPRTPPGHLSPYDELFKTYAKQLGWDWRLLAAIAYQESRFNPTVVAWSGAKGLMGIMPGTARGFGFTVEEMSLPDKNLRAGIECLRRFRNGFREVPDELERIKLTLASYNAGIGHIYDAQRLAAKYGKDPNVWDGNVAEYIRLKSEPQYYTDSLCKHGYLRGNETFRYVTEVLDRFHAYVGSETKTAGNQ